MKRIIVDAVLPDNIKVAVVEDDICTAYCHNHDSFKQNMSIYVGYIKHIVPSLDAVFVDFGKPKCGLLPAKNIHPIYFKQQKVDFVQEFCWHKSDIINKHNNTNNDHADNTCQIDNNVVKLKNIAPKIHHSSIKIKHGTSAAKNDMDELGGVLVDDIIDIDIDSVNINQVISLDKTDDFSDNGPDTSNNDNAIHFDYEVNWDASNNLAHTPTTTNKTTPLHTSQSISRKTSNNQEQGTNESIFNKKNKINNLQTQKILVQVVKSDIHNKGSALTTNISLQGKYVVLTPFQQYWGISSKITEQNRTRAREMMNLIKKKYPYSWIMRSNIGTNCTLQELEYDLQKLIDIWGNILSKATKTHHAGIIHQSDDYYCKFIVDHADADTKEIVVQGKQTEKEIKKYLQIYSPKYVEKIILYDSIDKDIFAKYNIDKHINNIYANIIILPSGGQLLLHYSQACVSIDVNSAKAKTKNNMEANAFATNSEAITTIAQQIILRNLSGMIFIDLIDMKCPENRAAIKKQTNDLCGSSKYRVEIHYVEPLNVVLISRQRTTNSLMDLTTKQCDTCTGLGLQPKQDYIVYNIGRGIISIATKRRWLTSQKKEILINQLKEYCITSTTFSEENISAYLLYLLSNKNYAIENTINAQKTTKTQLMSKAPNNASIALHNYLNNLIFSNIIYIVVPNNTAFYLMNDFKLLITDIEKQNKIQIKIIVLDFITNGNFLIF